MDLLRECCTLYRGNNPFHNYTKRKLYRLPAATQPAYGQLPFTVLHRVTSLRTCWVCTHVLSFTMHTVKSLTFKPR